MQVLIDQQAFDFPAQTLSQLLSAAQKHLHAQGRLIVEIHLDGQRLTDQELDLQLPGQIEGRTLQLVTADPVDLSRQVLIEVRAALDGARESQHQAAKMLQSDEPAKAMDLVRDALQVWQQAQQSVAQIAELLHLPLEDMEAAGQPVTQIIDSLQEHLRQIRGSLMEQDWLGLADTLDFDLIKGIEEWQQLLSMILAQLDQFQQPE